MGVIMIRLLTAGESHGEGLLGIIDGIPANLYFDEAFINGELSRRQKGYGRSNRMLIEKDEIKVLSGVRNNYTYGGPISIFIKNRGTNIDLVEVTKPRPGHGDLVGALKYNQKGGRNILERASARETAMRVALGSICKLILNEFNIKINSHVVNIGGVESRKTYYKGANLDEISKSKKSDIMVIDSESEGLMIEKIKTAMKNGDTLGGAIELIVDNVPPGLGSHINWDTKLDGLLGQALFSIPGIKAVEFGLGEEVAFSLGSMLHDEIIYDKGYRRKTNNAGGIEAGISNGEHIVIKIFMKPIPTLKKPLETVDMVTKEKAFALSERSDTCAVPAASIVAESMVAFVLAREFLKKFGGDFLEEVKENYNSYIKHISAR